MMRLVVALLALAFLAAPLAAESQSAGKVQIGWLTTAPHPFLEAFRQGLRDLGWVERQNLVIEERYAGGRPERLADLATELIKLKVNVIMVSGAAATRAAHRASASAPVVFVTGDPVSDGIVASLARPGGNVTGLALMNTEVSAKWVELIREVLPGTPRIVILWDPSASRPQLQVAEAAARSLQLQVRTLEARSAEEIDRAFQVAVSDRAGALVPLSSAFFAAEKQRIAGLAARHRLPIVYEHRDFVEAGGLMSYGPDLRDVFRRAAGYVDKILKGARPADLPVEQPTKFELVVNLKTAKALGLTIPPSVLARADELIE
jgi:putative ABC transport system substrate-binding protein